MLFQIAARLDRSREASVCDVLSGKVSTKFRNNKYLARKKVEN